MITLHTQNEYQQEETMRKVRQGKYPKGTVIEYRIGTTDWDMQQTKLYRDVYALRDVASLVQKKVGDGLYSYRIETR